MAERRIRAEALTLYSGVRETRPPPGALSLAGGPSPSHLAAGFARLAGRSPSAQSISAQGGSRSAKGHCFFFPFNRPWRSPTVFSVLVPPSLLNSPEAMLFSSPEAMPFMSGLKTGFDEVP
jgi:hypothetical protein